MAASAKAGGPAVETKVDVVKADDPEVAVKEAEVRVDAISHALNLRR